MKFYPSALSIVLGTHTLSSSAVLAFLPSSRPRTSTLSIRHDHRPQTKQITHLYSGDESPNAIISALAFYPTDDSLPERLKNVQTEFDNIVNKEKGGGIAKFFADEIDAAEKIIQGHASDAEKGADLVIAKSGSEDYLLKDGFHNMAEAGKKLTQEIFEVKQEFDELKAAKIVEEAAQDVVSTDVMVEKDLEKVIQSVVASLGEAEKVVQSAIATVASKEGLTDAAKAELTDKLEAKAQDIEEKIKVADSVAKSAEQIAIEDEKVMAELEKTGDRLSSAIEATESLTDKLKGTEGGATLDSVSNAVDKTASIVKEDLSAAESIADAIRQKVVIEAEAVMAMDDKAGDSVKAVRAAKTSIQDSTGGDSESLTNALTKDAADIKVDTDTAEKLADAISKDAANDEEALEVLERSSSEVNELINAVDGAVDKVTDAVGSDIAASSVKEAVEKIEEEVKEVKQEMKSVEEAVEECQDCRVTEVREEIGEAEAKSAEVTKIESEKEQVPESKVEIKPTAKSEPKEESSADDQKEEKLLSKSKSSDDIDGHEVEEKEHDQMSNGEPSEGMLEEPKIEKDTIRTARAEDTKGFGSNSVGETEPPEATTLTNVDHDISESLGDVLASTADTGSQHMSDAAGEMASSTVSGGEDLTDALASAEPPEGLGNVVASAAGAVSDLSESLSSSSDTAHDIATATTETLAEAAAVFSSLFL